MNISIKNAGSNYLARVVKLSNIRKHINADRLLCTNILNNNVIIGPNNKEGDLVVYFPLECCINKDYLSFSNSFSDPELNKDKKTKGFFSFNARVRCLKLRTEKSEGFIVPIKDINNWLGKEAITEEDLDQDFDTVNGVLLCEKYVSQQSLDTASQAERRNKVEGKKTRESKIIEGQYYLAADTEALKRNIHKIAPNDWITISYKCHGTNFSFGNVLCKKPLKWYEKGLKALGISIKDTHYDVVFASRRVIKNKFADKEAKHFYNFDIWELIAQRYKDSLQKNIVIHGEIVGQLPSGAWIQKGYCYGTQPGQSELLVYRIFAINPDGKVFEFNTKQIQEYCLKNNLKTVPIFYDGPAKDLFPELSLTEHWKENFLQKLIEKYNEKDCFMCKLKLPEEGISLIKNSYNQFEVFKLKSFRFLEMSSKLNDENYLDIDDIN